MKFHTDGTWPINGEIWVFGSNLSGRHGAGAAKVARERFGAGSGNGDGPTGQSFAIPTKGMALETLPLTEIAKKVRKFVEHTHFANGTLEFFVTRVGCGLAGYRDEQIAPMFRGCAGNCSFAEEWRQFFEPEAVAK